VVEVFGTFFNYQFWIHCEKCQNEQRERERAEDFLFACRLVVYLSRNVRNQFFRYYQFCFSISEAVLCLNVFKPNELFISRFFSKTSRHMLFFHIIISTLLVVSKLQRIEKSLSQHYFCIYI